MKQLGKLPIVNSPKDLVREDQTVLIGGKAYTVSSHSSGWFLDANTIVTGYYNNQPFIDLGINPYEWLEKHGIKECHSGGTFPWLTQEDITKAIWLLQEEFKKVADKNLPW